MRCRAERLQRPPSLPRRIGRRLTESARSSGSTESTSICLSEHTRGRRMHLPARRRTHPSGESSAPGLPADAAPASVQIVSTTHARFRHTSLLDITSSRCRAPDGARAAASADDNLHSTMLPSDWTPAALAHRARRATGPPIDSASVSKYGSATSWKSPAAYLAIAPCGMIRTWGVAHEHTRETSAAASAPANPLPRRAVPSA